MKIKVLMLVAGVLMLAACGPKDTEDLIIGTWDMVSVTHQTTGNPDQSLNGISTETYGDDGHTLSMTFGKDNYGYWSTHWEFGDSIYIYGRDSQGHDSIIGAYDTTYIIYDTMRFSYFATGNLLNLQEGGQMFAYRIDKIDKRELVITDTNAYRDTYNDGYGHSMDFIQETKTVMSLKRR